MRSRLANELPYRRCSMVFRGVAIATTALLLIATFSSTADAKGSSRSPASRARAAMMAQRNRMVTEIRQQIDGAKAVLKTIESTGAMTAADLNKLASQLESNANALKGLQESENHSRRELVKVEQRIIGEQGDDSEWAMKVDAIERDRLALEDEFHRVLKLPKDLAEGENLESHRLHHFSGLSEQQKNALDADTEYKAAEAQLVTASHELTALERKLFTADEEWKTANERMLALRREEAKRREENRRDGASNREARKKMNTLSELASQARATIAAGEAQLRELGVKP